MELSNEIFSQIAGVAVCEPVYEWEHERRSHPRVAFGGRAKISPLFDSMSNRGVSVMLRDISTAGIGFLCPQRLEISDEFIIGLRSKSDKLIKIYCIVRRCDPGGTGRTQFDVGATFELVLDTSAVPEEIGDVNDIGESSAGPAASVAAGALRSGGPIMRFMIWPVVDLFSGVRSFIRTSRNNFRLRRRLKSHALNHNSIEQPAMSAVAAEQGRAAIDDAAIDSLPALPQIQPFTPRAGGLFQAESSPKTSPSVEPAQTPSEVELPEPEAPEISTASIPVLEATVPSVIPVAEAPASVAQISEPIVQDVPSASCENASANAERHEGAQLHVQLEFPWAPQSADVQAPAIAPVATPPVIEQIETKEEFYELKSIEPAVCRSQSAVVSLLKERRSATARHPRRHPRRDRQY